MSNMRGRVFSLIVIAFLCAGCQWLPKKRAVPPAPDPVVSENHLQLINPQLLAGAQTLLIRPFTPGPAVPADEESAQLARHFREGFLEAWQAASGPMQLLLEEGTEGGEVPDLVLYGRIIERETPAQGRMKRWMRRQTEQALGIDAELVDYRTGRRILRFEERQASSLQALDFVQAARRLGESAAETVVSSAQPDSDLTTE